MSSSAGSRLAIVDDHRLLGQALALALGDAGFVTTLIDPTDDVVASAAEWQATIVLLDLLLGVDRDGDQLIAPLVRDGRAVVVLTGETDRARWGSCLLAGAVGVLPKLSPLEEVVAACSAAAEGRPVVRETDRVEWLRASDRHRREADRAMAPFRALTAREQTILAALLDGERASVIARRAVVSEATVRSQIRAVLTKLGVGSQLQAVAQARRAGWTGQAC